MEFGAQSGRHVGASQQGIEPPFSQLRLLYELGQRRVYVCRWRKAHIPDDSWPDTSIEPQELGTWLTSHHQTSHNLMATASAPTQEGAEEHNLKAQAFHDT